MNSVVAFEGLRLSRLESYEFEVDVPTNLRYLEALEGYHPRYVRASGARRALVHPGVLLDLSTNTRSPSYAPAQDEPDAQAKAEVFFQDAAYVGDSLVVSWRYIETYQKRGRPYVVVQALVRQREGREIVRWLEHATLFSARAAVSLRSYEESSTSRRWVEGECDPTIDASTDPEIGMTLRGRLKHITLDRMRLFSGPERNIHTDEGVARRAGLDGPIAAGTMMLGHLCELMLDYFGEGWLAGGSLAVTSMRPVHAGDVLSTDGVIVGKSGTDAGAAYRIDIKTQRESGELVCMSRARLPGSSQ